MQDILLVEDDEDLAEGIQMALGGEFSMIHCKTVGEAKHILNDRSFGLLILDVGLPDGSGLKLCGEIRKSSRVPIVLLTARDMETDIVAGLEYGADDYITKPFSATYLQARVENLLMQRKKLQNFYRDSLTHVTVSETPVAQGETLAGHASAEPVSSAAEEPAMPEMSPNDRKFMDKLVDLMEQNMDNGELVVDDLVRELAVSRSVFFKKLKTLTGLAPIEFIKEMRIKRAAQLIETGEFNMTQISYMVGINDPRYFSKCFKAQVGMTPTEYREKVGR